jgi:hypothetical protein
MDRVELQRFEGVWVGTEQVSDSDPPYQASARLVFQSVFDGRFLLCDYVQTAPDHPMSVGHAVFRRDEITNALTVTWFRSPTATPSQQADAIADGDKLVFVETLPNRTTRTSYHVNLDKMSVRTDLMVRGGEWTPIFEGTYRRR